MHGFAILFLLFLAVPIVEIVLLIKMGGVIGVVPTVALVIFTAMAGASLVRAQGLAILERARAEMARGGMPATEALRGMALLIAGALLLTPGFITDAAGFALLMPPVQRWLVRLWLRHASVQMSVTTMHQYGAQSDIYEAQRTEQDVIEGEFHREKD